MAVLLAGLSIAGCADVTSAPGSPGGSPKVEDPALSAAAGTVEPFARESFPDSYAGLRLDHEQHLVIIYRKPDPGLDTAVRAKIPQVSVQFQDARFSLVQMNDLTNHVLSDAPYWRGRGVEISSVRPAIDGSGVEVMVSNKGPEPQKAMFERYGEAVIIISSGGVMPIPPGPRFMPPSSTPATR